MPTSDQAETVKGGESESGDGIPTTLLPPEGSFSSDIILHTGVPIKGEGLAFLPPTAMAPGLYAARDYYHVSPPNYPLIGGHRTFYWDQLEPSEGQFQWHFVHSFIAEQVAEGKKAAIGISTYNGNFGGIAVPNWFMTAYPFAIVTCGDGHRVPKYWHFRYLEKYGNFVRALGREFDGNPNLAWVQIGTGLYGENQPSHDYYDACLQSAGLDSATWMNTSNAITDLYINAFRVTPVLFQFAPRYLGDWERPTCSDYAASRGAGLMHDGLVPDRDKAYGSNNACNNGAGHWDPIRKYWQAVPISFESYKFYLPTHTHVYWGVLNGLAKHADYLNVDKCLLNECDAQERVIEPLVPRTENFPIFRFANRYLGRTLQNTPSVWVALRETEYIFCPDAGNFEFWLYQDNDAPQGRTVPEWNVSPHKEGRYTRRTDQATGNRYMYFNVDDGYIYGGPNSVVITVRYYDYGTDRWRLHYQATTDTYKLAGEVQKTDSRLWLTATFTLDDARFVNWQPGGNDFRIDCTDNGNEWIHMVDVRKVSATTARIPLVAGANLVSLPLVPQNTSLTAVLSSVSGSYTKVFSFVDGEWKRYIVGAPSFLNNLNNLDEKMGFWIYMSSSATLSVSGASPGTTSIALRQGPNMVGYPGRSARPVTEAMASIAGRYSKIFTYVNGVWRKYIVGAPSFVNDLTHLEPGRGYWIYTTEACTWTINN